MFNIASKYFSLFNNKPPASWVAHITRDFLACYSCLNYSSMIKPIAEYTPKVNNIHIKTWLFRYVRYFVCWHWIWDFHWDLFKLRGWSIWATQVFGDATFAFRSVPCFNDYVNFGRDAKFLTSSSGNFKLWVPIYLGSFHRPLQFLLY